MGLIAAETNGTSHDTEALYREHGAAIAGLCRSLLRDRSEAEDATQQVFLSAHRALLNGAAPREPLAWLLVVARNECYARFRQRAAAPLLTGEAPETPVADASTHVLRAGELATVWDEVGQMPEAQREAFLLREIRGLSYGQLAAELALSPPSVRSLLLRARTRLRERLRDVAAAGAPWLQSLLRIAGGGEGGSPVPAATKAAAAGLGALALIGGGDVPRHPHLAAAAPSHGTALHATPAGVRHVAAPATFAAVTPEHRSRLDDRGSGSAHPSAPGGDSSTSSSNGHDGAGETVQERGSKDGSSGTSSTGESQTDTRDGGSSGTDGVSSGSGSDTGSDTTTTQTTTTETTTTTDTSGSSDGGTIDGGSTSGGSDGGVTAGSGG